MHTQRNVINVECSNIKISIQWLITIQSGHEWQKRRRLVEVSEGREMWRPTFNLDTVRETE